MNFYIELLLIDAVLHPRKVKDYLRVDTELHQKKVRGLINKFILISFNKIFHTVGSCVYIDTNLFIKTAPTLDHPKFTGCSKGWNLRS